MTPVIAEALAASGTRIVITGAGGWLGMATLELLHASLGNDIAHRVRCFGSSHRKLTLLDGTVFEQRKLSGLAALNPAPTILLHLAFLTKDRVEAMDEAAYRTANRALDQAVFHALGPIGVNAVFVASSGAAYRADDPTAAPAMRLYGGLKRDQEAMFANWATASGKRAIVARIFNISGPHINKHASYALAAFILDALAGRPITINAPHRVVRSYVAVRELMALVFALLLEDTAQSVRFDTGGDPMEMQDIAQAIADLLGPVAIVRPPQNAAISDVYTGDPAVYRALLADHAIVPGTFAQQVLETAAFLALGGLSRPTGRVATAKQSC